ncbi:MAG: hypothetical protein ACPGVK_00075 [Halocynthiibacter sp.]
MNDIDPRNLIRESYRIEGITAPDCRAIFFDWALGMSGQGDMAAMLRALLDQYAPDNPDHPMTDVLKEAIEKPEKTGRRGGRRARVS